MFEHTAAIFFRSLFGFVLLLLLTRWLGKKQMAQLTYFDYITGITIGSIAASIVMEPTIHMLEGGLGLLFWAAFTYLLNTLILKNRRLRKLLDGEPCLVVSNGQILEENMRKLKFTLDDLMEELREKNVFSISDVQFAVLETDGKLSIQLKPEKMAVVRQDIHAQVPAQTMPVELIMDGQIVHQNLIQRHLSEEWLRKELAKRNIQDPQEVTYACLGTNLQLYLDTRNDPGAETFNLSD